jgi:hypothetical protein
MVGTDEMGGSPGQSLPLKLDRLLNLLNVWSAASEHPVQKDLQILPICVRAVATRTAENKIGFQKWKSQTKCINTTLCLFDSFFKKRHKLCDFLLFLKTKDTNSVTFSIFSNKKTQLVCLFVIFKRKRHKHCVFLLNLKTKDTSP